ncbi:hypothetical protein ACRAWG_09105 [Methylobacterium sp. P31]
MIAGGPLMLIRWIRAVVGGERQRIAHLPLAQDAVRALRTDGIMVMPCGDEFQHWQLGDFVMTDADLIRFAVSRGLIAGD